MLKRLLTKKFGLKTRQINGITAEIVGPVSEQLESEIVTLLKADPQYADYPFMHFRVRTNNSFERVNHIDQPWGFLPIGGQPTPLLFVSETGRGDGSYEVKGEFVGERICELTIDFLAE